MTTPTSFESLFAQLNQPEADCGHDVLKEAIQCMLVHGGLSLSADETLEPNFHQEIERTYRHSQSSFTFHIKQVSIHTNLVVLALAEQEGKVHSTSFKVKDHVHYNAKLDRSEMLREIQKLEDQVKSQIIDKLVPMKVVDQSESTTGSSQPPRIPASARPQHQSPPEGAIPPGPPDMPQVPPLGVGSSDLDPFGTRRPGGGMIMDPDHPIFAGNAPLGMNIPPGMVPPGARFDPLGPLPSRGLGGLGANPRIPPVSGRGRPPRFPGEPDSDDMPPPGYSDMFM